MENYIKAFFSPISLCIYLFAIIAIGGFVSVRSNLSKLDRKMNDNHKKSRSRVDYTKGGYTKNQDVYTWGETLDYMEDFNKILVSYSVFEQFIPIFPLLGILGTVYGIMKMTNIDEMYNSLNVAMVTTFVGLIAAIGLKFFDAVFVSKGLEKMRLTFETFEQDYQFARDKHLEEMEK